ncbi:MAG TPA: hypothetical protein VLV83_03715 [Acidobacteriota bacterium]|nr:hypothetical protein [Acidobacteriota bacterium]
MHLDETGRRLRIHPAARTVEIALMPSLIGREALGEMARDGALIRQAMLKLIRAFRRRYRNRRLEGHLFESFLPYRRWWPLVEGERRRLPQIQFMRFDVHYDDRRGRGLFLETNSDYPGGFLQCALIRQAWIRTSLAESLLARFDTGTFAADRPQGFLHFLVRRARQLAGESRTATVAICTDHPGQRNEVLLLQRLFESVKRTGGLQDIDLLLCRMQEVECGPGGGVRVRGRRVDLIHNELEFLDVDPGDHDVAGWLRASRSRRCDFLNGLGACYLTQTKRIAAVLTDPRIQAELGLSAAQRRAARRRFPPTRTLEPSDLTRHPSTWLAGCGSAGVVLKPDALGMGQGVVLGRECTAAELLCKAPGILRQNGVIQRYVALPRRPGYQSGERPSFISENYGFELFYWGSHFAGPVSRSSPRGVVNVSKGGRESPVLVVNSRPILL